MDIDSYEPKPNLLSFYFIYYDGDVAQLVERRAS